MTELLSAAQMRALEQAAIGSGEVTGLELMERAGRGVVDAVFEAWPALASSSHRAMVLCGPGNNGGDGFVVARLLKQWGWQVDAFVYGDPARLPPDAKTNYRRWCALGQCSGLTDAVFERYASAHPGTSLVIDALFGTGLVRPFADLGRVRDRLASWSSASGGPHVVSIDIPSGMCSDSGRYLGPDFGPDLGPDIGPETDESAGRAVRANLTVSFHSRKLGQFIADGPMGCGTVVVKPIGLGHRDDISPAGLTQASAALLAKRPGGHKYSHGHALVLSGGPGQTGAARLAARGALRIGAGLVTLGVPPSAQMEVACQSTAVMLKRVADADALLALLGDARLNALCLGPGFGTGAREQALVGAALAARRPVVLDADALSVLLFDEADALFGKLHDKCVLTPHAGEFARMFPDIAERLKAPALDGPAYSKVDATRAAARRAGCVVLFKGPDTVIADPSGRCRINSAHYQRAAPWLATAGSGDVLAGFITGLLARGFAPMQAAETAAWLHVQCALSFGPGLIGEDITEELPKVLRSLGD